MINTFDSLLYNSGSTEAITGQLGFNSGWYYGQGSHHYQVPRLWGHFTFTNSHNIIGTSSWHHNHYSMDQYIYIVLDTYTPTNQITINQKQLYLYKKQIEYVTCITNSSCSLDKINPEKVQVLASDVANRPNSLNSIFSSNQLQKADYPNTLYSSRK